MTLSPRVSVAVLLAAIGVSSHATTTTYTTSASFLAAVAAGAYTEAFTGLDPNAVPPTSYGGGGFTFDISATNGLYATGTDLGTNQVNEALTITFTSGNVFAVGGNFYAVDINPDFQSVSITLTLGDGTVETFTPTSIADSYRGFVSTSAITSLVISPPGAQLYATVDNLTAGAALAVPEPATWALAGIGGAALLLRHRRRAA